jgi:hypothetical protein
MLRVACNRTLFVRRGVVRALTIYMVARAAAMSATTCSAGVPLRVVDSAVSVAAAAVTEVESKCAA